MSLKIDSSVDKCNTYYIIWWYDTFNMCVQVNSNLLNNNNDNNNQFDIWQCRRYNWDYKSIS